MRAERLDKDLRAAPARPGGDKMIVLNEITKHYTMGDEVVKALDGVSMTMQEGEYVAIIGPSGSGKSTLMNIIGCLDVADDGTYLLDEMPIEEYSEQQLANVRNEKIGFIFQGFNLINKMNAYENVELPLVYSRMARHERKERVMQSLELVGLVDRMKHRPNELSGGQQQRVAIARALATKPSIILADEPTGNLDSRTGMEIMNLFDRLNEQGHTIVLITHDNKVAQHAKRQISIMDGKISNDTGEGCA